MQHLNQIDSREKIQERLSNLWNLLTEEEKKEVDDSLYVKTFKKNEMVYHEGESPDHMLCLLSGKVKIFRDGVGGRSQIMRVMRPVQYFGYRASLAGEPYITAAAAFEESTICCIPMSVIKKIISQNIAICQFFIKELATDLGIADCRTVSLTQKHIRGRLAEAILFLKETYGMSDDGTLGILLSREDLANLSNMTTSNAIRTLSTFATEGFIAINGRTIKILQEEALVKISKMG